MHAQLHTKYRFAATITSHGRRITLSSSTTFPKASRQTRKQILQIQEPLCRIGLPTVTLEEEEALYSDRALKLRQV